MVALIWREICNSLSKAIGTEMAARVLALLRLQKRPPKAQGHVDCGDERLELKDPDGALQAYDRAHTLAPNDAAILLKIATVHEERGEVLQAYQKASLALAHARTRRLKSQSCNTLGLIALEHQFPQTMSKPDIEAAITCFKTARELQPDDIVPVWNELDAHIRAACKARGICAREKRQHLAQARSLMERIKVAVVSNRGNAQKYIRDARSDAKSVFSGLKDRAWWTEQLSELEQYGQTEWQPATATHGATATPSARLMGLILVALLAAAMLGILMGSALGAEPTCGTTSIQAWAGPVFGGTEQTVSCTRLNCTAPVPRGITDDAYSSVEPRMKEASIRHHPKDIGVILRRPWDSHFASWLPSSVESLRQSVAPAVSIREGWCRCGRCRTDTPCRGKDEWCTPAGRGGEPVCEAHTLREAAIRHRPHDIRLDRYSCGDPLVVLAARPRTVVDSGVGDGFLVASPPATEARLAQCLSETHPLSISRVPPRCFYAGLIRAGEAGA